MVMRSPVINASRCQHNTDVSVSSETLVVWRYQLTCDDVTQTAASAAVRPLCKFCLINTTYPARAIVTVDVGAGACNVLAAWRRAGGLLADDGMLHGGHWAASGDWPLIVDRSQQCITCLYKDSLRYHISTSDKRAFNSAIKACRLDHAVSNWPLTTDHCDTPGHWANLAPSRPTVHPAVVLECRWKRKRRSIVLQSRSSAWKSPLDVSSQPTVLFVQQLIHDWSGPLKLYGLHEDLLGYRGKDPCNLSRKYINTFTAVKTTVINTINSELLIAM